MSKLESHANNQVKEQLRGGVPNLMLSLLDWMCFHCFPLDLRFCVSVSLKFEMILWKNELFALNLSAEMLTCQVWFPIKKIFFLSNLKSFLFGRFSMTHQSCFYPFWVQFLEKKEINFNGTKMNSEIHLRNRRWLQLETRFCSQYRLQCNKESEKNFKLQSISTRTFHCFVSFWSLGAKTMKEVIW